MRLPVIVKTSSGFTLVEIIVAALVFALAATGLFAVISSLNRPSVESFEEVRAVYIAKGIFEQLKSMIDAELWDETDSSVYYLVPGETYELEETVRDGIAYTANYTVTQDSSGGRWVDLTVWW